MRNIVAWMFNGLYVVALLTCAPWLAYRSWQRGLSLTPLMGRFRGDAPHRNAKAKSCVWLHAVSVGEVGALNTLILELQFRLPETQFVLSTTTASGFRVAQQRYPNLPVFYSPLDFSWSVRRALRHIRPDLIVFCELEIWPNWVLAAAQQGVRTAIVNGRLSQRSFRGYSRFQAIFSTIIGRFDVVACQTEADAARFRAIGATESAVSVTGSLKFDGAEIDRLNSKTESLRQLAEIGPEDTILLAGSTSAPEEQIVLASFAELAGSFPRLKLILVPRHPERFAEVAAWVQASGYPWVRRSQLDREKMAGWRVLLVDSLGELGGWWGVAQMAYVGGSMGPREGQNMIEPAAYGAAVCFGPRTKNFRDVVRQLLDAQAAEIVENRAELTDFVRRCLVDVTRRQQIGNRAQAVVLRNQGATQLTAELLVKQVAQELPTG
ncbi:MAG: 3-deoxy-D-manno-octulosonic acid transferase, partial [Planctomycetota bacterium]|nr:3-deoxy-D-manno-octulosonic acid transferase [Planctomycetota bacterium]